MVDGRVTSRLVVFVYGPSTRHQSSKMSTTMRVRSWHVFGGAALYAGAAYGVYSYLKVHKLPKDSETCGTTFDAIADRYDQAIGAEEFSMGTSLLRKWLCNHAVGDVLEISAGTGANGTLIRLLDVTA